MRRFLVISHRFRPRPVPASGGPCIRCFVRRGVTARIAGTIRPGLTHPRSVAVVGFFFKHREHACDVRRRPRGTAHAPPGARVRTGRRARIQPPASVTNITSSPRGRERRDHGFPVARRGVILAILPASPGYAVSRRRTVCEAVVGRSTASPQPLPSRQCARGQIGLAFDFLGVRGCDQFRLIVGFTAAAGISQLDVSRAPRLASI